MTPILENIDHPEQLKNLSESDLEQLAGEIRETIIATVAQNGGHLASNLGVVELTMALLLTFDFRRDQIVFDVGHQVYAWKLLTGRREQFCTLRKLDGISGFPKQNESCYDFFNTGHSSTSISAALGMSRAMAHTGRIGHTLAVIGDGALTGGMAFEALNDAGQKGDNLIVILNDNQMSIGRNVGGLSRHLEKLRISTRYIRLKSRTEDALKRLPVIGRTLLNLMQWFKRVTRFAIQDQGSYFEQLGFRYYGPIDGHDLPDLLHHMKNIQGMQGPILLHVLTQKGRGYRYAEESPDLYHGVAPFMVENGLNHAGSSQETVHSFSEAMGRQMVELARRNPRICAISAAMTAGTGLTEFEAQFPARFYDVGIAEQHAMTMAAGMAAGGMRPVVAIYSTFLQRAYDQVLHDICLQCLPVVIAVDRAGIVGEDGETHQGIYDLSLLLPMPGLEIFCPPDYRTLRQNLAYALSAGKPVAIRYPRGKEWPVPLPEPLPELKPGSQPDSRAEQLSESPAESNSRLGSSMPGLMKINCLRRGSMVTLAVLGTLAGPALKAATILADENVDVEVLSIVCVKPLDVQTLIESASRTGRLIMVEEALSIGGFAQSVLPGILSILPQIKFKQLGIEDQPLCQGSRDQLLRMQRLDPEAMAATVRDLLNEDASPA